MGHEAQSAEAITCDWSTQRPGRATLVVVLFLGLVTLLFFREPVFTGKNFYIFDHAKFYVPMHVANAPTRGLANNPGGVKFLRWQRLPRIDAIGRCLSEWSGRRRLLRWACSSDDLVL